MLVCRVERVKTFFLAFIALQLQAALLDIHEIFFIIPVEERMALIAHSRQLEEDKKLRESVSNRMFCLILQTRL